MIDLFQYQAFYEDWQELNKACGKIKKQNNIVKMGFYRGGDFNKKLNEICLKNWYKDAKIYNKSSQEFIIIIICKEGD